MSARQPNPFAKVARKWLALTERRSAYLAELRDSGRWRHYYTLEQLAEAMREANDSRDVWAKIASAANGEPAPGEVRATARILPSAALF